MSCTFEHSLVRNCRLDIFFCMSRSLPLTTDSSGARTAQWPRVIYFWPLTVHAKPGSGLSVGVGLTSAVIPRRPPAIERDKLLLLQTTLSGMPSVICNNPPETLFIYFIPFHIGYVLGWLDYWRIMDWNNGWTIDSGSTPVAREVRINMWSNLSIL